MKVEFIQTLILARTNAENTLMHIEQILEGSRLLKKKTEFGILYSDRVLQSIKLEKEGNL